MGSCSDGIFDNEGGVRSVCIRAAHTMPSLLGKITYFGKASLEKPCNLEDSEVIMRHSVKIELAHR